jgi:nucleoside 2-deoxyribosyltransferase
MNRLKDMRVYLSGPIDKAADRGVTWRRNLTKTLKELGLMVFDPTVNITNRAEEDDFGTIERLKAEGKYDEAEQYIRMHLLHTDLRLVDICDFLIVYIDPDVFVFGTVDEMVNACQQRKPVLAVVKGGKLKAPN